MDDMLATLRSVPLPISTQVALVGITAWITFAEPWLGVVSHRRFLREVAVEAGPARLRFYAEWTVLLAVLGAAVSFAFAVMPGIDLARLGWPGVGGIGHIDSDMLIVVGGLMAGLAVGGIAAGVAAKKNGKTPLLAGAAAVSPMLPRTRPERLRFILLAATASVAEEIVWRGFVVFAIAQWLPTATPFMVIGISAVVFGIAHLYQGWVGMLATACLGGVLCVIYMGTGNLLLPIVLHFAVNLRAAFTPVPAAASPL